MMIFNNYREWKPLTATWRAVTALNQSWGIFTNLELTQSLPTCTIISFP